MESFDLIVIGAGPGGYVSAIRGAAKGLKTAVIEYDKTGGTCLNRGCIPTKTIKHSAGLYHEILKSADFGIDVQEAKINIHKVYERKNKIVADLQKGIEQLMKANKITYFRGKASIKNKNTVIIRDAEREREIGGKNIIIATGSVPSRLPETMQNCSNVFTSDEALGEEGKLYKKIVIIGGGVIGVEFASIYNAMGCEVTVIEYFDALLNNLDREISQSIGMLLKKRGINVFTGARVTDIQENRDGLKCIFTKKDAEEAVDCDGVLVCVGRKPFTEGLFEDGFSLEMERGFISINENMQTSEENIYAIGDCTLSTALAHGASAQGLNAVSHIVGEAPAIDLNAVPACIYTDPEIAQVGLTADKAKEKGIAVKTGKYIMSGNAKTMIEGADRSFIKLVFDAETTVILGAQLMCPRATDLISELSLAIVNKLTAEEIASVIHPHPTFTEGVVEACEDIFGLAVHMAPKRSLK